MQTYPLFSDGILDYHERTKHHFNRNARSLGYLDWDTQPNPFRFYEGCESRSLPLLEGDPLSGHMDLYKRANNAPNQFTLEPIAAFLELSLGISAWKGIEDSKWALRMNPSSGNLHPTEAHLILPEMDSLPAGVYHYDPYHHALELRATTPEGMWSAFLGYFQTGGFIIGLSSIFWRESWKYGERAYRYCNLDAGHALACLSFAANLQGWKVVHLNALSTADLETILGFDRTTWPDLEAEHPDLLCIVFPNNISNRDIPRGLSSEMLNIFSELSFGGVPNRLSSDHIDWETIYDTAEKTRKPRTPGNMHDYGTPPFYEAPQSQFSAAQIIRKSRSGASFDPRAHTLSMEQFLATLDKTRPRDGGAPFDLELGETNINLLIFIHSVEGLIPGLYFFLRNEADGGEIKRAARSEFIWEQIDGSLPLYLLAEGDVRQDAIRVSCHQEIAGQSAFSVGMIARFREIVTQTPYRYPHLFWEAGMVGQVLYLESEAYGLSGTGIGCFYDDPVHEIMGLSEDRFQCLYHFTVGRVVRDSRLETYPPYHHLEEK
jgi:SagB-type dehydrogenase family enzyme